MTRGQMEIMGLAIVVILITLGVLFALTTLRDEAPGIKQQFEMANIASGFLKTFIKTNVPCGNDIIRNVIKACVEGKPLRCDSPIDGRSVDACVYVNETLWVVLNKTLDLRNSRYFFTGTGPKMGMISAGRACPGERIVGGPQPIATGRGNIFIELHICA